MRRKLDGGALICALHEGGTSRELYFEDADAAVLFAKLRGIDFEPVERARGYRAEDYVRKVNSAWTEVEHRVVL